jgi:subtilisin-like proprotein convertase family protein
MLEFANMRLHGSRLAVVALVVFGSGLLIADDAVAAVPGTMHFEGTLRASGGGPAADGTYKLRFALYDTAKGGAAKWTVGPVDVKLASGRFGYVLGSTKPLTPAVVGTKGLWVELKVGTEPALARQPLASVPFALAAGSIDCTGCVKLSHIKFDGDLDLTGYAIKATKISANDVVASTVSAQKFVGDGSALTGIKAGGAGVETKTCAKGSVVVGVDKNGKLICASSGAALPIDGLEQISNGTLSNKFTDILNSPKAPIAIPDHVPVGVKDDIVVPDLGIAQEFSVSIDVSNSKVETLTINLLDPNNKLYVLFKGGVKGKTLLATFPNPTKPVSGDLTTWKGKNLKGKWTLQVIDPHFKDNKTDGAVNKWSINIQTLSNQKVLAKGKLVVTGDIEIGGKIIVKGQQEASEYPMFPKGSRPFVYGWIEDRMGTNYQVMPFYQYAGNVGTSNKQFHDCCSQIRWGDVNGNIRVQRGGSNGGTTSDRSAQIMIAFIKNTTASTIKHKICTNYSSYGNSNNYASLALNGGNQWNYTSTTVSTRCDDVTFPKNQASSIVLKTGSRYWTHYSNNYYMRNIIGFHNNTWKLPAGLEWDYKRYNDWLTGK